MCADALSASRKQTESVAELRRGFVDDEGTVQMRAGGGLRFTEVPGESLATKGIWWMPRRSEPTKGAISCEKPRGAASKP